MPVHNLAVINECATPYGGGDSDYFDQPTQIEELRCEQAGLREQAEKEADHALSELENDPDLAWSIMQGATALCRQCAEIERLIDRIS